MFVHLLMWNTHYDGNFLESLMKTIFNNAVYCLCIIIVCPPGIQPGDAITLVLCCLLLLIYSKSHIFLHDKINEDKIKNSISCRILFR